MKLYLLPSPVAWGCRIYRLHLSEEVRPLNRVLDMALNNLILRLQSWSCGECRVPPLLPSLPGPFRPRVVAPDSVQLNNLTFKLNANKWLVLNWIVRNRTVWSFNCVQTNDRYLTELLVIYSNTWNCSTVAVMVNYFIDWFGWAMSFSVGCWVGWGLWVEM